MKYNQAWSEEDCQQFIVLMKQYHNDFKQIATEMNRTYSQIRSHYYNLLRKPKTEQKEKEQKTKPKKIKPQQQLQQYIIFDDFRSSSHSFVDDQ
ncbi:SANT/Myb_domain [Hexamita inflata]|uniref:SANT/Myb domain n=1 Tax=Hexamita inflata TaxID=28002 RepID=A0AA86QEE1_9EUKA|nr:SANT/Myb domain [Hexamita inflata]